MKRNLKIIALAGVLVMCLILTGCYQPPDEVNNGGPGGVATTMLFSTIAPSPTVEVTPDTITVETQNIFNGQDYGQTPTPTPPDGGGNGWDNWGVSNTPTPTKIPDGVIVFNETPIPDGDGQTTGGPVTTAPVTPPPTEAPVTPTPTPASLQRGFTGSEAVRTVQKCLKELGYYKGSADGDFGPATEEAVKAFQKANGLKVDGKVGQKTLAKMSAKNVVSASQANATATPKTTGKATVKVTNTPKPTATANLTKDYYLTVGSKGKKVETLQRRLIELGWLAGSVTGTYDEATEAAVSAFQKKTAGLWEDGVAGPDTLRALYSSNAARGSARQSSSSSSGKGTLEMGSEGSG